MILVKTLSGQQALKDRHGDLTPRQRSAFILFDGQRALEQVLAATAAMGITVADVKTMVDRGLLQLQEGSGVAPGALDGAAPAVAAPAVAATAAPSAPKPGSLAPAAGSPAIDVSGAAGGSERSPMHRYQAAYPIATALTAQLGLRGFRLNLAVEGVGSFDELAALAPRIREAVGEARFAPLQNALYG